MSENTTNSAGAVIFISFTLLLMSAGCAFLAISAGKLAPYMPELVLTMRDLIILSVVFAVAGIGIFVYSLIKSFRDMN